MAEEHAHTETTGVPEKEGGFPPFDTSTFPSQFFWLAITFAFLFTVVWRVAGPRINGAITNRRGTINGAIAEAGKARADADTGADQGDTGNARTDHFCSCKFHFDSLLVFSGDVSGDREDEVLR